jgi:uncharacterized protein (TIGR02246 family)
VDTTLTAQLSEADEAAVRELVSRAQDAQNDLTTFVPLHTPDVVLVNFPGRRVLGRDALADAMAAALASPLQDVRTSVEIIDIRLATSDVAVVSCIKTVHDARRDASTPLPSTTGALTYVLTRINDSWRIALAQTTPILGQ